MNARPTTPVAARTAAIAISLLLLVVQAATSQDFTEDFGRENCTFSTTGNNPYWPLLPGYVLVIEGEEEDDGETVTIRHRITVTGDTKMIDGVLTRVVEEYETEDEELVEISYNFVAHCRETGDVWYFGEDVEDYEDGELVGSGGEWRAGVDGAKPGILMPGTPILGARFYEEIAPNAQDRAEIISMGDAITVPVGAFMDTLTTEETNALEPGDSAEKVYAAGVGIVKDETLELIEIIQPPCMPDATTHCLAGGRFEVKADWTDFDDNEGDAMAILPSDTSGEFWFFTPDNTEILVKVLDACDAPEFESFWVFAAGLTNVELTIEVRDTVSGQVREYENDLGQPFAPVLDTAAFATCP